ncbi:MAG: hypothetical protein, partial [Olavius algarvensis Gamma 1 endosymbiont]
VARAQGERGTGMSRFASRARRHSDSLNGLPYFLQRKNHM